ncbi:MULTISPECIES: N-acetylmuramoyl-L-alanine amidase family protein [unclassified Amedibacterium]|uniref:N-acetylmuramoyl-L-alanine amidase family protein n=1 Tax=unclassified Amedibacterium TaxID=3088137 RepID=UPI000E3F147C|nr:MULTISPECIES: N-acetylmuramoyl-L-alanine amidase [unclassified Absiella]RGB69518.1 N-acetylmuramoyl-L-alanine amidase [Absiella sp. AM09-45]RGB77714.1 N-acetylmuramoyl-L-alanine amidase [Absiella sp. AM09-50]
MKKNFIQRNIIWISLILLCFTVIPGMREKGYALDKEHENEVSKQSIPTDEKKEEKIKVVIDPGHGGYDSGSESTNGKLEKNLNLNISKKVGAILEKNNIEVIYTRTDDNVTWSDDNVEDLLARSEIANESNAKCFVSIHMNFSEEYADEIRGHEVWVNYDNNENVKLAENIISKFKAVSESTDRGIKDQAISPLSLLTFNHIPSVLVEVGFISNEEDSAFIESEDGASKISEAIANGIIAYVNEK